MIPLSEKKKRAVVALIQERVDEHLKRFPYARYPVEPLEEWYHLFCDPATVTLHDLRKALGWHFGGWQRQSLPSTVSRTLSGVLKAWPDFVPMATVEPGEVFKFWSTKLPDWGNGFGVAAFLLHLQRPDSFELADRHRIEAMVEIMREVGHMEEMPENAALTFADLERYTAFFRSILPKMPYKEDSRTKLDRFLKIFGNRHAYKMVSPDFQTKEPSIRSFSWDSLTSERFSLDQITGRANCDVLFACFLLTLESESNSTTQFTIGEVVDLLPIGTAGICNEASFRYALVSLFSQQRQRDFWVFDNPEVIHAFTEQANQSTRDMKFYDRHAGEKLKVNEKYLMQTK